jgi:integrase/recombinase XerD
VAFTSAIQGSAATRARRLSAVKSLLSYAHATGYAAGNPGRSVRVPRVPSRLHERILEEPELQAVVRAAPHGRAHALVRFIYATGCRISEAVRLRWADVGPGWVTLLGKGTKVRSVVVPQSVVDELRRLRAPEARDTDAVFVSARGRALSERQGRRLVEQASLIALGRSVGPHTLRHCHATHAIEHGAPLHLVQRSLGHASVATTSVYLHVRPGTGSSQYLAV